MRIRAQRFGGLQICRGHFAIDSDGGGAGEFVVQGDVQMAAAHAFAHHLADARLERLKTFRHAQMQIEETVIHAAHG